MHAGSLRVSLWALGNEDKANLQIRCTFHIVCVCVCVCVCACAHARVRAHTLSHFSHVRLFVTPGTVAHRAPLSMEFSRQEY